ITPDLNLDDYLGLFSNPTQSDIGYWMSKGERSTWPLMSLIKNRCVVEFALEDVYQQLRTIMLQGRAAKHQLQQQHPLPPPLAPPFVSSTPLHHEPSKSASDILSMRHKSMG
ncbi:hypothetical protein BC828DRAFT_408976, partial [Blastocladiella britannica]